MTEEGPLSGPVMDPYLVYISASLLVLALVASLVSLIIQKAMTKYREKHPFGSIDKVKQNRPSFFTNKLDVPPFKFTIAPVNVNPGLQTKQYDVQDIHSRGLIASKQLDEDARQLGKWRVWFQLHYDMARLLLEITIFRLKAINETSLPHCLNGKIYFTASLMPNDDVQMQTQMIPVKQRNTLQETMKIKILQEKFHDGQLRISMYAVDEHQCRKCCGHTVIKLGLLDFDRCETYYFCNELDSLAKMMTKSRGEMHICLCYDIGKERLTAQVFAARNLPHVAADRKFYMKTILTIGRRRVKVDCGETCNSLSGIFKGNYSFHVPHRWLQSCNVQFLICELKELSEKRWGHVVVGSSRYAHGSGLEHWNEMIAQPAKLVEMWHTIRHG